MVKAGSKRQSGGDATAAAKKQKTDKKKIAPQKIEKAEKIIEPVIKELTAKFKNPEDSIQFLLQHSKVPVDEFFKKHWEKTPLAMHADEEAKDYGKIFGFDYFCQVLKETEAKDAELVLIPERDFVFSKYVDGKKEELEFAEDLTETAFVKVFNEDKYSVQIHQPQRVQDALWALMEKMECYFGCIAGANVYMTPEKCQMLAPHYDDVDVFVIQLEGSKTWKLYKPHVELANEYSDDLAQDKIGEPVMTVTLKPGDVLYMPRGTIHQAQAESRSTHVTLSTYQKHNVAAYLGHTFNEILRQEVSKSLDLRRGLPIGLLPGMNGISANDYADQLTKLADHIRKEKITLPHPEEMVMDFMTNRLPPFGMAEFDVEAATPPAETDKVQLRNKQHFAYFLRVSVDEGMDEMDEEEDNEVEDEEANLEKNELYVMSSAHNDRATHSMVQRQLMGDDGEFLTMDEEFKPVLDTLMKADEPVSVASLKVKSKDGDDMDVMPLIMGLFNLGALEVCK